LVRSAMDGYKVCIFSYGQTGSGKTFTMEGDIDRPENKGMIPRAVEEIFNNVEAFKRNGWTFALECSFQEIYIETQRDLLDPSKTSKQQKMSEPTVVEVNCLLPYQISLRELSSWRN